jgi:hypothetical protein
MFPTAANYSPADGVSGVAVAPFPGLASSFAVVVASDYGLNNSTSASLTFALLGYSAEDAERIALNGSCGPNCGSLPLNWSDLLVISNFSAPISAESIAAAGSLLVVAATSAGATYLFNWSLGGSHWNQFGPVIGGTLASLADDPQDVLVATLASGELEMTTVTVDGTTLGQQVVPPANSTSTGVLAASVALVPNGPTYLEGVAFTTLGSDEVQFSSSTDGVHFAPSVVIGNYTDEPATTANATAGETSLVYSGGQPGQVGLVAIQSQLFVLFTTYNSSQVVPVTESSASYGAGWQGPYFDGPVNGTTLNPSLTVGPTGLVYAVWEDPDFGQGAVEEATYFADGTPVLPPETLVSPNGTADSPTAAPSIAVDNLARPLVAWPTTFANPNGSLAYTGGYPSPIQSVSYLQAAVEQGLAPADLTSGSAAALTSLLSNVSVTSQRIEANESSLTYAHFCAAQNLTALSLYQNVTSVALNIAPGSGTVCSSHLNPRPSASPLLSEEGLDVPTTYLAVYSDWALESEGVPVAPSPLASLTQFSPYLALTPVTSLPASQTASQIVDSTAESVTVTPTPYSPTAYELVVSGALQGWGKVVGIKCFLPNGGWAEAGVGSLTSITSTSTSVSILNGPAHVFTGTSSFTSVWIYDLPADQSFTWSATFTANTTTTTYSFNQNCQATRSSAAGPSIGPMALTGSFATVLAETYVSGLVTASYNANRATAKLSVGFDQTLPATARVTLVNSSGTQAWNSTALAVVESYAFPNASAVGVSYNLALSSTSRAGGSTAPGSPSFAYGTSGNAPPETASADCEFTLTKYVPLVWNSSAGPYTNVTGSNMTVQWFSNESAQGFFTYYEVGSSINSSVFGIAPTHSGPGVWTYETEVHGLEPWGVYNGTFGVSTTSGCLTEQDGVMKQVPVAGTDPAASTVQKFGWAWEQDQLYDSTTRTGGGMEVGWSRQAVQGAGSLTGGLLMVGSPSAPVFTYPIVPSDGTRGGLSGSVTLDPPLSINTAYPIDLELNYSYRAPPGSPCMRTGGCPHTLTETSNGTFTYEKDTSGDGLSDVEKQHGWVVPGLAKSVTPNFLLYSNNGLASDFLEKEYDLDPFTVDTANSGMLDLWNLTFDLGNNSSNPSIPSVNDFHLWWEISATHNPSDSALGGVSGGPTYIFDPFQGAPYPNDSGWNHAPINPADWSNLSCTRTNCPGNYSWSAEVLWSGSALAQFLAMPGVHAATAHGNWLRGIVGTYGGERTLTLWGKTSWGANPLVASTPANGIPDGSRINPVGETDLRLSFSQPGPALTQMFGGGSYSLAACTFEPSGSSFALRFWVNDTGGSKTSELSSAYGQQINITANDGCNGTSGPSWAIPVDPTAQFQHVTLQVLQNNNQLILVNGSSTSVSFTIDMLDPPPLNYTPQGSTSAVPWFLFYAGACPNAGMEFGATAIPSGGKAPTLLWVPDDGSSLSSLSPGLERYVGAQNFVLIAADAPTNLTATGIPGPGGTGYTVGLTAGMNNLLVPTGVFGNSTLGQALLGDRIAPDSSSATPPLLQSGQAGNLVNPWGLAALSDLACYWQNRAVNSDMNNSVPLCSAANLGGSGVGPFSGLLLTIVNATPIGCRVDCGGVPTEASVESGQDRTPALGGVIGLNVENLSVLYALLAGILDNATGGVNGTFPSFGANQVATLDLPTVVLDVMANATVFASPIYGPPVTTSQSQSSPKCGWCASIGDAVWNTFDGAAKRFASGVKWVYQTAVTVLWNPIVAGADYLGNLVAAAARLYYEFVIGPTVKALAIVGQAIINALNTVWKAIVNAVESLLSGDIKSLKKTAAAEGATLESAVNASEEYGANSSQAHNLWWAGSGSPVAVATVLALATTFAVAFVVPFSVFVGPIGLFFNFVLGNLVGLPLKGIHNAGSLSSPSSWPSIASIAVALSMDFVNGSNGTQMTKGELNALIALIFGGDIGMLAYIFSSAAAGLEDLSPGLGIVVSTILMVLAIVFTVFAALSPSGPYALLFVGAGITLAFVSLLLDLKSVGISSTFGLIVFVADLADLVFNAGELCILLT